ncbi:MAG: serine/threonine protein kinase, partial [Acidobacteria bacterium]|nr:serine/threonine protein kinase [Acidobacteriota bacterium]
MPFTQFLEGKILHEKYRIEGPIGAGGMGAVFRAEHLGTGRPVAVKTILPSLVRSAEALERFRREARAAGAMRHPNIVDVTDSGATEDGSVYFVMEYLDGRNLAQLVRAEGPMDADRAISVMVQVCGALEEAHQQGIVHRDLKPENIFLTAQGGITDFPKVLDFGLAKVTERQMRPGSLILTQEGM